MRAHRKIYIYMMRSGRTDGTSLAPGPISRRIRTKDSMVRRTTRKPPSLIVRNANEGSTFIGCRIRVSGSCSTHGIMTIRHCDGRSPVSSVFPPYRLHSRRGRSISLRDELYMMGVVLLNLGSKKFIRLLVSGHGYFQIFCLFVCLLVSST